MALARQIKQKDDPELVRSLKGSPDPITRIRFNENMKQIGSVDKSGTILIYDFRADMRPSKYKFSSSPLYDILFLRSNNRILTCGEDKTIRMIPNKVSPSSKSIKTIINNATIRGMSVSQQEDVLISYGDDKVIKIWDLGKQKFMSSLKGHNNIVSSSVISSDGRLVVSGGHDKSVRLWDVCTNKSIFSLQVHQGQVNQVLFKNNLIYSASHDNTIKIHDSRCEELVQMYECSSSVKSISLSSSSNQIASGEESGLVKIWDGRIGQLDYTLHAHSSSVNSIEYSFDSAYLASAGNDRQILIWDNHKQQVLREGEGEGEGEEVVVKKNNKQKDFKQQQQKQKQKQQQIQKQDEENENENEQMQREEKERIGMKIHQTMSILERVSERMVSLDSRLSSNEQSIDTLLSNPLVSTAIKKSIQDTQLFNQKSFKSVWEGFQSVKANTSHLLSFNSHQQTLTGYTRINTHITDTLQVSDDTLQVRQDMSEIDEEQSNIDNPFQNDCLADSSGQIITDMLRTKTQKQLIESLRPVHTLSHNTLSQTNLA